MQSRTMDFLNGDEFLSAEPGGLPCSSYRGVQGVSARLVSAESVGLAPGYRVVPDIQIRLLVPLEDRSNCGYWVT